MAIRPRIGASDSNRRPGPRNGRPASMPDPGSYDHRGLIVRPSGSSNRAESSD
jgi:hypothetical protein